MTSPIQQLFARTDVPLEQVEDFLLGIPRYRESGRQANVSPYAGRLLHRTDCFEFELRQYLAGESPTRYHLNRSIRTFLSLDEPSAKAMIRYSLNAVESRLIDNEWYELMPVYQRVRKHIEKTFAI